jgi:hypothetical protein
MSEPTEPVIIMNNESKLRSKSIILTFALLAQCISTEAGSFFSDFESGFPSGSTLYGSAAVVPSGGFTNSGYLSLTTPSPGGQSGSIILSDLDAGTPVVSFTAAYKVLIGSFGNGADGMSFNFAPDLPLGPITEEGAGTGYTVEFDTFLNPDGTDTAPSIDVKVGGASGDHSLFTGNELASAINANLRPNVFVDAVVQLNPNNTLTVIYDGAYVYSNLDLSVSGYAPAGGSVFGIGARTGGQTDNHWLDNLSIVTRTNATPYVNSFLPIGRAVATNSPIDIVLTDNGTQVRTNTIVLKLDGVTVSGSITTNGAGDTFIHYIKPGGFALNSTHAVGVTFSNNAVAPQQFAWQYSFTVVPPPPFVPTTVDVFKDSFETYIQAPGDDGALDKNLSGGPNAAPNGSGNPWWGPFPANLRVVGTENGVTPHSGTNMVRGLSTGGDFDQEYYNLTYRLRGGVIPKGNFLVEWWFYDPAGAGSTAYKDYVALATYTNDLSAMDYPNSANQALPGNGISQRLSLGAAPNTSAGVDYNFYQARIVGSSLGYSQGNFNTITPRTVGWHQARIVLGPPTNSQPDVAFYIDDMVNPTVAAHCPTTTGFQLVEVNSAFGATPGYFDDFRIALAIPPKLTPTRSGNNLVFTWPGGFVLQSATNVNGPYTDVPGATNPFSYDLTSNSRQFFRLKN